MLDKFCELCYNREFCPFAHENGQSKDCPTKKRGFIQLAKRFITTLCSHLQNILRHIGL